MARQPRLILPEVAVHIVQRGNDRMACFRGPGDYLVYLAELKRLAAKFDCAVHAYCLMRNHVHLLATPRMADACGGLMKELSQGYAHYFNRKYARIGTLWEGRFRSCVAQSARYVLACYRYIELNPVRAGIVVHPGLYPWSSYAANAGMAHDAFLTAHAEFLALASETRPRHHVYRALVEEGVDPQVLEAIRAATNGGYPLAAEGFKSSLALPPGRQLERARAGRRVKPSKESVPDTDLLL
jgi:putative transposase